MPHYHITFKFALYEHFRQQNSFMTYDKSRPVGIREGFRKKKAVKACFYLVWSALVISTAISTALKVAYRLWRPKSCEKEGQN